MSTAEAMKRVDAYDMPKYAHIEAPNKPAAITAATDKLKETHVKFIEGLRNELNKLYDMRSNVMSEIQDKEQALAVCEQLLYNLSNTEQSYPTSGAKTSGRL